MIAGTVEDNVMERPKVYPPEDGRYNSGQVYDIPLDQVFSDDDFNCRGMIDPGDVLELAKDIEEKGLLSPIIVQPWNQDEHPEALMKGQGKRFRVVAGYRRVRAHRLNKAETVQALIRTGLSDLDARILNLSENVQRKDLNILQEAKALDHFRRARWDKGMIARKIGMSRGWVEVRYMLLELPQDIQKEAAAGLLTQEQIRKVHNLGEIGTTEDQYAYIRGIKDKKLGIRKTDPKAETRNQKRVRGKEEMWELQDAIRETLGNNLTTRAIAYGTGEIDDNEMYSFLHYECKRNNVYFAMPEGLELLPEDEV